MPVLFNILSLLSFANAVFLMFMAVYSIMTNRKSRINQSSALECFLLAEWAFCYSFFYIAPNKMEAWFWMKLGSVGWSAFMGVLVWFFLEMTRYKGKLNPILKATVIAVLPVTFIILNLLSPVTAAAVDITLSASGFGWTYINTLGNWLYWMFIAYIAFGTVLCAVILKKRLEVGKSTHFKRLVIAFLVVDGALVFFGFILDLILPLLTDAIPPLTNIFLLMFSISYWIIISKLEVFQKTSLEASEYVLNTISDALMVLDKEGYIIQSNKAATDLLQYDLSEMIGKHLITFFNKDNFDPQRIKQLDLEKKLTDIDTDLLAKDGSVIHARYSASVVENDIYGFMGIIISFHDITKLKKLEQQLYRLAHFDPLTGLPNRRYFLDALHVFEANYHAGGKDFAIFFMDLNGFKKINDIYGHVAGDLLLMEAGKRIAGCASENDVVARMGGDEFVMLMANVVQEEQLQQRKREIIELFKKEVQIEERACPVGVSIGSARYSETDSISALLRNADQRMYEHKTNRCNPAFDHGSSC